MSARKIAKQTGVSIRGFYDYYRPGTRIWSVNGKASLTRKVSQWSGHPCEDTILPPLPNMRMLLPGWKREDSLRQRLRRSSGCILNVSGNTWKSMSRNSMPGKVWSKQKAVVLWQTIAWENTRRLCTFMLRQPKAWNRWQDDSGSTTAPSASSSEDISPNCTNNTKNWCNRRKRLIKFTLCWYVLWEPNRTKVESCWWVLLP